MKLRLHHKAVKQLNKAPNIIKEKFEVLALHIIANGLKNLPFRSKQMRGKYKQFYEILLHDDYRIVYRIDEDVFFVRYSGTHNYLGTG